MASEFVLPELGENIESGDVVSVLVAVGDVLQVDDPVLELETDKATVEVPSTVSGKITAIEVAVGDTIQVGQVILTVNGQGDVTGTDQAEDTSKAAAKPASAELDSAESSAAEAAQAEAAEAAEAESSPAEATPAKDSPEPAVVEISLPELGESITEGDVVGILVAVGDTIAVDQGLIELETDKATAEVPATVAGVVKGIHVQEGETISVGQLIVTVETTGAMAAPAAEAEGVDAEVEPESVPAELPEATAPAALTEQEVVARPATAPEISPNRDLSAIPAAPIVRRLARELGVNLASVQGSGPGGRVSLDDVKAQARKVMQLLQSGQLPPIPGGSPLGAAASLPDFSRWGEVERQPMSNIRKATARQMASAWATVPHVTQFDKADISDVEQLRKRFGPKVEEAGGKLTITAILLKVVAAALREFPQFNASLDMAAEEVVLKHYFHIGVAVDTDRGLLVPVIRNVDKKNIMELAVELGQVAEKARDRKLRLEDMQGGTFTLTNLGGIGGTNFTPIVNAPEVAILGVARGGREPVFKDGQFEPRLMLPLSLSYDHRLIDGADGARFLRFVVEYLEQPFLTALQGW